MYNPQHTPHKGRHPDDVDSDTLYIDVWDVVNDHGHVLTEKKIRDTMESVLKLVFHPESYK